jgi:hypothetical protein
VVEEFLSLQMAVEILVGLAHLPNDLWWDCVPSPTDRPA